MEAFLVEPRDPSAGGDLEVVESSPVAAVRGESGGVAAEFGRVDPHHRLGHSVLHSLDSLPECPRRASAGRPWGEEPPRFRGRDGAARLHSLDVQDAAVDVCELERGELAPAGAGIGRKAGEEQVLSAAVGPTRGSGGAVVVGQGLDEVVFGCAQQRGDFAVGERPAGVGSARAGVMWRIGCGR